MSSSTTRPSLYLVRHGATEWSVNGRHTGRTDLPLLPEGEAQAAALTPVLAAAHIGLVLTSPLQRARHTCQLAGLGDRAEIDPDLLEWDYGDDEGRTTAEIRTERPGWTVFTDGPAGGETIEEVAARVDRVVARARAVDGGDTVAFAHGHVLRVLAARWCGLDPIEGRRLPLETGRVCVLGWERDVPGIHLWNATG